jgi:hypothetical protein
LGFSSSRLGQWRNRSMVVPDAYGIEDWFEGTTEQNSVVLKIIATENLGEILEEDCVVETLVTDTEGVTSRTKEANKPSEAVQTAAAEPAKMVRPIPEALEWLGEIVEEMEQARAEADELDEFPVGTINRRTEGQSAASVQPKDTNVTAERLEVSAWTAQAGDAWDFDPVDREWPAFGGESIRTAAW